MALSKRTSAWINKLSSSNEAERTKAAANILALAETHFDRKRPSEDEWKKIRSLLIEPVSSDNVLVREATAYIIGLHASWADDLEPLLRRLLSDTSLSVKAMTIWAVGRIGPSSRRLSSDLLLLATEDAADVRWRVSWALGCMEGSDEDVSRCLLMLMKDEDETVRLHAINALASCNPNTNALIANEIVSALDDPSATVRAAACRALSLVNDARDETIKKLAASVDDQCYGVSLEAVHSLCKLSPEARMWPSVQDWLQENKGYWWVNELLEEKDG